MLYANYYSHMYVSTDFNISLWAGNELSSRTSIVVNFCWPCCGLWVESAFAAFHVGSPRVLHYIMDRNRNWNRIRIRKMGSGDGHSRNRNRQLKVLPPQTRALSTWWHWALGTSHQSLGARQWTVGTMWHDHDRRQLQPIGRLAWAF